MYPNLFKIGSFTISSYSFMSAFGFLIAVSIAILRAKKFSVSIKSIIDISLYILISG
ncbi:MAG: prolipoprotein diacylglyceryl transferase family protein, partial [Candidatus Poribacteria bacterium]